MNKTLTVNIGGLVFHIEEAAYQNLDQYLKAIRSSISIQEQDEVIHDIEIRIAELFSENITLSNQVVTIADVERVIGIMGKPEDYKITDDENQSQPESQYIYTKQPKLYRDTQKGMIGGVLAGLGHYFKIDTVWLRIIFLVLLFFYGTGVLLYIIMWAVVPAARTSSEILEMQGKPININTIEKKVKENIDYVTNKFNDLNVDEIKQQMSSTGTQAGKIIQKFAGIFFTITALFGLLGTSIASIALWINQARLTDSDFNGFPLSIQDTYPTWIFISLLSFILIIPFIGLLMIGLKLIYTNIKYVLATIISLFILWIVAIIMLGVPFMNIKTYENLGDIAIPTFITDTQITDNFELDEQYNELKIVFVQNAFFTTDKKDATPYLVTDSIAHIGFELLPTFQTEIYGNLQLKQDHNTNNTTDLDLDNNVSTQKYFDLEDNILYVATEHNSTALNMMYTIYLPTNTKVKFSNLVDNVNNANLGSIKPNKWYTMQEDDTLKTAEAPL